MFFVKNPFSRNGFFSCHGNDRTKTLLINRLLLGGLKDDSVN